MDAVITALSSLRESNISVFKYCCFADEDDGKDVIDDVADGDDDDDEEEEEDVFFVAKCLWKIHAEASGYRSVYTTRLHRAVVPRCDALALLLQSGGGGGSGIYPLNGTISLSLTLRLSLRLRLSR